MPTLAQQALGWGVNNIGLSRDWVLPTNLLQKEKESRQTDCSSRGPHGAVRTKLSQSLRDGWECSAYLSFDDHTKHCAHVKMIGQIDGAMDIQEVLLCMGSK